MYIGNNIPANTGLFDFRVGLPATVTDEKATGGLAEDLNQYRVHTFLGTGTFVVISQISVEYLIAAGGGAGGYGLGSGGGGAGGMLLGSTTLNPGTYPIIVGAGGCQGNEINLTFQYEATNGSNSSAFGLTAVGGGRGGAFYSGASASRNGISGGSGGGSALADNGSGGTTTSVGSAGSGTSGQGSSGGTAAVYNQSNYGFIGGGGGGAGGNGSSTNGAGGPGVQSNIDGRNYYYCGGGGGSAPFPASGYTPPYPQNAATGYGAPGGVGGGGGGGWGGAHGASGRNFHQFDFRYYNNRKGGAGGMNTGSGGGASYRNSGHTSYGGPGGSGIVIVRYVR